MRRLLFSTALLMLSFSVFCTEILFISDKGWCEIFFDGTSAGKIPLNKHKTTVEIEPGDYVLRIADSFDKNWYDSKITIPDTNKITIQVEPDFFEIISLEGKNNHGNIIKAEMLLDEYSVRKIKTLLYITSETEGLEILLNGKYQGKTPYSILNIKPGKYKLTVKMKDKILLSKTILVKKRNVTHITLSIDSSDKK